MTSFISNNLITNSLPTRMALFLFVNNIITSLLVLILIKCMYELKLVYFKSVASCLFVLFMLKLVFYAKALRRRLNLIKQTRMANSIRDLILQSFSYAYELPLSVFVFFCFTQVHCAASSVSSFYIYFFFLLSVYLSIVGILNAVLIENVSLFTPSLMSSSRTTTTTTTSSSCGNSTTSTSSNNVATNGATYQKETKKLGILFVFLFRYFYFLWRAIGLALLLSTYNDDYARSYCIFELVLAYLFVSLGVYIAWWFVFVEGRATRAAESTTQIYCNMSTPTLRWHYRAARGVYESLKMLIDYNHIYMQQSEHQKQKSMLNDKTILTLKRVAFFVFKIAVQTTFVYVWYYRAILLFHTNQKKTTLFSLLAGYKSRLSLVNLFELEEKIKLRQLALLTMIGCLIVSLLCYHIYYAYYHNEMMSQNRVQRDLAIFSTSSSSSSSSSSSCKIRQSKQTMAEDMKRDTMLTLSSSLSTDLVNSTPFNFLNATSLISAYVDKIDGFSINTYEQSSSIHSSISPSSEQQQQQQLYQPRLLFANQMKINPIFKSDHNMSEMSSSALSQSSVSSMSSVSSLYEPKHQQQHDTTNHYETSSGIMSSGECTTNSDLFSLASSLTSVFDNSTYLKNCEPDWFEKLDKPSNDLVIECTGQTIQDKVLTWFNVDKESVVDNTRFDRLAEMKIRLNSFRETIFSSSSSSPRTATTPTLMASTKLNFLANHHQKNSKDIYII